MTDRQKNLGVDVVQTTESDQEGSKVLSPTMMGHAQSEVALQGTPEYLDINVSKEKKSR